MLPKQVRKNLPYGGDAKATIEQHLLGMIREFQQLQAKTASFTHNDGRTSHLLQGSGTIPMFFKDVKYNIPITIWLVEAYPRAPPLVFLTPTPNMIINAQHRYVDASGNVTVPYLQQWAYPRSNLVELIRSLSLIFSADPPVYSRPSVIGTPRQQQAAAAQTAVTSPPFAQSSIHATNPLHVSAEPRWSSNTSQQASPAADCQTNPSHPSYTLDSSSPGSSSRLQFVAATPDEAFRANAIVTLTERLLRDSGAALMRGTADINRSFNTHVRLNQRKDVLDQGLQELQREKEVLEEQLQIYSTNTDVVESWLEGNEVVQSPPSSVDELFQPIDDISRQLLECTAADLAIDDILYSLDRAVQDGCIDWDTYYRSVRQLSREQFYYRATSLKASAVLRQIQIGKMAGKTIRYHPGGSSATY